MINSNEIRLSHMFFISILQEKLLNLLKHTHRSPPKHQLLPTPAPKLLKTANTLSPSKNTSNYPQKPKQK